MKKYVLEVTDDREFWGPLLLWVSQNCPIAESNESQFLQGYHSCLRGELDDSISHILFHNLGCSQTEYRGWEFEAKEGCVVWGKLSEKINDCCSWEALPKIER